MSDDFRAAWEAAVKLCAERGAEIERLHRRWDRLGFEVIEIDGVGHYVNEKVKTEIGRLRFALRKIIELDHHNHGAESPAAAVARSALTSR